MSKSVYKYLNTYEKILSKAFDMSRNIVLIPVGDLQ